MSESTRTPLALRASFAPVACKCAAATVPPRVRIESGGPEADLGSAVHEILAGAIGSGGCWPDADWVARKWGADPGEVYALARWAWNRWQGTDDRPGLSQWFPAPVVEEELIWTHPAGVTLSGHPDVVSVAGDAVHGADWKSGFVDADYADQLRAYALLALNEHPGADRAYFALVRIREQCIDGFWFTRAELDAWAYRLSIHLRKTEAYNPGPWCGRCPRLHECPAVMSEIRQLHGELAHGEPLLLRLPADRRARAAMLTSLHARAKLAEGRLAKLKEIIRAEVEAAGGALPTGDGAELRLVEQEQKRLAPREALPVLLDGYLTHEQLHEVMTLPKGKVEDLVAAGAGRGKGAAALRELRARLEAAGAYATTVIRKLELKRVPQPIGVHHGDGDDETAADSPAAGPAAEPVPAAGPRPGQHDV